MTPQTLCQLFYGAVDTHRKSEHLMRRTATGWVALSSDEVRRGVEETAMGLRALGVERGDRVAILSENRPEWVFADFGTLCLGAVDVPIYPTLSEPQVAYILRDSAARVAFVSSPALAARVVAARGEAPSLEQVVCFDPEPAPDTITLDDLRSRGRDALGREADAARRAAGTVRPEDLATLIYTSGTTGEPKGVMLTHRNLTSNVLGAHEALPLLGPDDVALSFLPLSHSFERTGHNLMLHAGATIAYAESVDKVPANMLEVRPTAMCSVPRLYEKMYARVNEKVAKDPPIRQAIFRWASGVGARVFAHRVAHTSPSPWLRLRCRVADRLVFSKIRERTGGRLRLFVSGGAPLSREIAEFFGAAGLLICEGYGLTETSPVISCNRPDRLKPGTVGLPLADVEVKIAADGEILTRGPHIMKGYLNKPEATAEVLDADGWFHTGDIGHVDADGFLAITDRKKDILVTSGGKNIAPQPIENALKTNRFFAEVVMVGDRRNYAAALVVPGFDALIEWARARGLPVGDRAALVARPEVAAHYMSLISEILPDLAQYEKIKKVAVLPNEFSQETGELTPTLKVKRRVVAEKYKDVIDRLYAG